MPVKITNYVRLETQSLDDLTALLQGRVFHVTELVNLELIMSGGGIKPNTDGTFSPAFGNYNSFFRNRNCVSLFDYRAEVTEDLAFYRAKCSPFDPALSRCEAIAIFMLKQEVNEALVPWTRWKEEEARKEMVVPYVEAGHEGPISVDLIEEIICLEIEEDPNCYAALIRRIRREASS